MQEKHEFREPIDLTDGGNCSSCGNCCSSLLPVSEEELRDMKAAADRIGFSPSIPEGENVIYLHCPFLEKPDKNERRDCAIYPDRPAICRSFLCSRLAEESARDYVASTGKSDVPEARNVWSVYGKTGLRLNGHDIPYEGASAAELATADNMRFRLQVGRAVSLRLVSGRVLPPSLILNIYPDGVQVFDAEKEAISIIKYSNIQEIMTRSAMLGPSKANPGMNRKQRREKERRERKSKS